MWWEREKCVHVLEIEPLVKLWGIKLFDVLFCCILKELTVNVMYRSMQPEVAGSFLGG
jgi:hypothetical protein